MRNCAGLTEYRRTTQQVITIPTENLQSVIIIALLAPLVARHGADNTQNHVESKHRESEAE